MPKKIILVRHGETDYNKERRMQGWLDIPLNETGHQQAKAAANIITREKIDALYSSDLLRAVQTAEYFARILRLEIKKAAELRERDMGIFSGWLWGIAGNTRKHKLWAEFERARDQRIRDWKKHKGESIGEMIDRTARFLENLEVIHTEHTILLVTHGGTINNIFEHYGVKKAIEGFRAHGNASINILIRSETGYQLETPDDPR